MSETLWSKDALRKKFRKLRAALSISQQHQAALLLAENLQPLMTKARRIAIYFSAYNEISLEPLIATGFSLGIKFFAPVAKTTTRVMQLMEIRQNSPRQVFYSADFAVPEAVCWEGMDLVILPVLAMDKQGYRLGQGGGYYDATLAALRGKVALCGVGYDWQLIADLPHDSWDLPLNYFGSDQQILSFNKY